MKPLPTLLASLLLALTLACGARAAPEGDADAALVGTWRAVLASPGGELPFTLEIRPAAGEGGALEAVAVNGAEEAPFSAVRREGDRVVLAIDWYDSRIEAGLTEGEEGGAALSGRWTKGVPGGTSELPFSATRGEERRFLPLDEDGATSPAAAAVPSVAGTWAVEFRDAGDPEAEPEPARGELRQEGERVTGTFLTPTGDYRFLAGEYRGGRLRLSCFDGAHAFLFDARAREDGTLAGDFWSRDSYHATWTARPLAAGEEVLPDAFELAGLTNDEGRFAFTFPDLEGRPVSLDDPRFAGKVVVVNLFGSWCPNCNDEAPLLAAWHRRYRDRGLEIVGLAYEFSGDAERDRALVRRYAERHGIEFPLLLAGVSDKAAAAETLPDLTSVVAYPTSLFLGRDGRVRRVHSGFAGPATGEHHERLAAELEGLIEELLAEPPPAG